MVELKSQANVAELVDALDLGFSGATRESSSLSFRTTWSNQLGFFIFTEVFYAGFT